MPTSLPDPLPDVQNDADLAAIVDDFYGGVVTDDLLGPFFSGIDMAAHLPRMVAFWSSVVFGSGAYRGRPFDAHLRLEGLTAEAFARWVERFQATIDAGYDGPNARLMKARAEQIAGVFKVKLGLWSVVDAPGA